jgi:hypothetical protein
MGRTSMRVYLKREVHAASINPFKRQYQNLWRGHFHVAVKGTY